MDHVDKHHAEMNDKWTPKWIIDTEGLHTNKNKPGVTRGNPYKAGIAKIYIHPSAFDSPGKLYIVVGHELIHSAHHKSGSLVRWTKQYGWEKAQAISEYYGYSWQVQQEERLFMNLGGSKQLDYFKAMLPAGFLK